MVAIELAGLIHCQLLLVGRFMASTDKWKFFTCRLQLSIVNFSALLITVTHSMTDPMNVLDLLSILPLFINMFIRSDVGAV